MPQSTMLAVAVTLVLAVLGFALWYSQQNPRRIVGVGSMRVESGGRSETLRTRSVAIGTIVFQEIELPNGTWIACSGDCAKAAHDASAGFWEQQNRDRR